MNSNKYECRKPSNIWCIKFKLNNPQEIERGNISPYHDAEVVLRRIYRAINEKC